MGNPNFHAATLGDALRSIEAQSFLRGAMHDGRPDLATMPDMALAALASRLAGSLHGAQRGTDTARGLMRAAGYLEGSPAPAFADPIGIGVLLNHDVQGTTPLDPYALEMIRKRVLDRSAQ